MQHQANELRETYNAETHETELTFLGFEFPKENWSRLPHELIAALPLIETLAEMKVILYVLRHTWGYKDDEKKITMDEFVSGRKRKDRTRLDNGLGMSEPAIRDGIERAINHGFLHVEVDDSDAARIKKFYSLKMNEDGEKDLTPKDLPSGGKKLTLRGKETLPRTEKETLERNSGNITYPQRDEEFVQESEIEFVKPEPRQSRTPAQAKASVAKTLSSFQKKESDQDVIGAYILSVARQSRVESSELRDVAASVRKKLDYAARLMLEDLRAGKYTMQDIKDTCERFLNGEGDKYRKFTCAPTTVAADMAEYISRQSSPKNTPLNIEKTKPTLAPFIVEPADGFQSIVFQGARPTW